MVLTIANKLFILNVCVNCVCECMCIYVYGYENAAKSEIKRLKEDSELMMKEYGPTLDGSYING